MADSSLKSLWKAKQSREEAKNRLTPSDYEQMDMDLFHKETMKAGKWAGLTFQALYEDHPEYVSWVVDNANDKKCSSDGMQTFLIYIHRCLKMEEMALGKGDHQKTPPSTKSSKAMSKAVERGYPQPTDVKKEKEIPVPESESEMSDFEEVDPANHHRMVQMEGSLSTLHQRMNQVEQTMQEMLYWLRQREEVPTNK